MPSLSRRTFCLSAPALAALPLRSGAKPGCLLLFPDQHRKLRQAFPQNATLLSPAAALKAGPWSVTSRRPANVAASRNDYYSEGPYWWPDPKNPKGPYIRKDGERNPDRFMANRSDLGNMCSAVLALGVGAAILGDRRCADHAATVLSTWFVDPKTRMNPNLEYGQAVRGVNTGRGTGLIDTVSMIHAAQGVALLAQDDLLDAKVLDGVRRWYADFLHWMTTSEKGLDEKKSGNNHATWWTAQVSAYASLVEDSAAKSMAWDHYRKYLVPTEIQPDGSCPREEARTDSLSYSAMNLDAFAVLCRIAEVNGESLWQYRAPSGVAVSKSFDYLAPFLLHPETWRKQQMAKFNPEGTIFPGLAGVGLKSSALMNVHRSLSRSKSPWVEFIDAVAKTSA